MALNEDEGTFITQLQNHDEDAFRKFIAENQKSIYNLCIDWVINSEDAEELAQDVFVEAHRKITNFRGEAAIKTWLIRIAINKCQDFLKAKNRMKRSILNQTSSPDSEAVNISDSFNHPGFQLDQKENAKLLYKALDEIPIAQKTAFILFEAEELSYEEIAQVMNKSISSIESLLSRSRESLRKKLSDYFK
jgi:RNA polymerase sigma factor (sigma-70 family)